ncbi:hypothetical protein ENUP19_0138G0011 [Entamoeba nuttalli]|uniref:Uncharacterized protein n=1 Tax=Entamoeba nuttalli TaxID=412467 RepID=A0ABQ0DK22_9EUKA
MFLLLIVFASATETILCMDQGIKNPSQCQNILVVTYPITSSIYRANCIEYAKRKSLKVYTTKSDQTNNIGYHIKYFKDAMCDKESENQNNDNVIAIEKSIITKTSKRNEYDTISNNVVKVNKSYLYSSITKKKHNIYTINLRSDIGTPEPPKDTTPEPPKDTTPEPPKDDYNEPSNLNASKLTFITFTIITAFFFL